VAVDIGVHACLHAIRSRLLTIGGAVILLSIAGCQSPAKNAAAVPNSGPSAPDVRTQAVIIQMENQYVTDKNDQPTHQHEVEAEAAKKAAEEKAQKAAEQAAQEKQAADAGK
jgi:hypothetical protein